MKCYFHNLNTIIINLRKCERETKWVQAKCGDQDTLFLFSNISQDRMEESSQPVAVQEVSIPLEEVDLKDGKPIAI